MLTIIFIAVIILMFFFLSAFLISGAYDREMNVYNNGIEADSIVIRVEAKGSGTEKRYHSFVKYVDENGEKHEGCLNVRSHFPIGREIRIKYIPGKFENVVFVSQNLDTPRK